MEYLDNQHIYDLEIYQNIFTYCSVKSDGTDIKVFEISDRKNQLEGLLCELRNLIKDGTSLVGFNNLGFDYNLLHYIMEKGKKAKSKNKLLKITASELYDYAQKVIDSKKNDSFGINVKSDDILIRQIDLYKIYHFDNKARATSLKMLEFNMRSDNIEDLPYPVGMTLNNEQKDILIEYNKHDVMQTLKFYKLSIENIKFREDLTVKFGFDCTNLNDTKIGKELFINEIEKVKQGTCFNYSNGRKQLKQTPRDSINIGECILPYIKFKSPEFNAVLDWMSIQNITETKGVFSDIEEHLLGDLAKYCEMVTKKVKFTDPENSKNNRYIPNDDVYNSFLALHPLAWFEEKELVSPKGCKAYYGYYRVAKTLNVIYKGFRFDFGVGGIHGSVTGTVKNNDDYKIWDHDVKSYYPNLSIKNKLYPEHLTELFCDVYQYLYIERGKYDKKSGLNKAIKLALNGTYGESNNEFSCFYDPKFTMSITINGQLSLCMLVEKLHELCDIKMIQANTDGISVYVNKESEPLMFRIIKAWEKYTKLEMESVEYKSMFVRDVNNYIAVYTNNDVKRKGAYEYENLDWSKNHSSLVIAKAVEYEVVSGGDSKDFIKAHKDPYDFMLRAKVPRSSKLVIVKGDEETQLQNICRYYPSKNGGKLVKLMPPLVKDGEYRRLSLEKDYDVTPCNDMKDFNWMVNYDYYFNEVDKLIEPFNHDLFIE